MSYSTQAEIQHSQSLTIRCTAAVASEVTSGGTEGDTAVVGTWVSRRSWDIATTPSWDAKWESALAGGITDPGESESVITDEDILSRVQQLLAKYPLTDIVPPT